jgi:uncharacterized Zn-binding protein involved in type VI secretion
MLLPASRVTDFHICPATTPRAHIGGPILPPGAVTVFIEGHPAARATDLAACSCAVDIIRRGSATVLIAGHPAARLSDPCVLGVIIGGAPTVLIGGPASRPPLEQILADYQVQDDEVINWSPHILGFSVDALGEQEMTKTEGKMLDKLIWDEGMAGLLRFKNIKDKAFEVATARYPDPASLPPTIPADREEEWLGNDGQRDAFRHAYWNALIAKENGPEWAKEFTTAHEGLPGNPAIREAMDLYNNEVGRMIAAHNPDASDKELADMIQNAIERGDLLVVDKGGKLAWSDQVQLWEHGLAPDTPGIGGQALPKGDVSAES